MRRVHDVPAPARRADVLTIAGFSTGLAGLFIALLVIVLCAGFYFYYSSTSPSESPSAAASPTPRLRPSPVSTSRPNVPAAVAPTPLPTAATPMPSPATLPSPQPTAAPALVLKDAFSVGPNEFRAWSFEVPFLRGQLFGRFRAEGGRNDIECYVLDADGYENFANGHSTPTFYNSQRKTVATVNIALPKGRYHLIFNNRFSAFTPKAVVAEFHLRPL